MRYREVLGEHVNIESPAFRRWFRGSQVVDGHNQPLLMYHGAFHLSGIDLFQPLTHFGTLKAAHSRINDQVGRPRRIGYDVAIYPVYLAIKNPLRIVDRTGVSHKINDMARYLAFGSFTASIIGKEEARNRRYGKITFDEYDRIMRDGDTALIDILSQRGHDGMVYQNRIEDRGSNSWVIFHPSQVWPLYAARPQGAKRRRA
jgi:hypothetical protein